MFFSKKLSTIKIIVLSVLYRLIRFLSFYSISVLNKYFGKNISYETVKIWGQQNMCCLNKHISSWIYEFPTPKNCQTQLYDLTFSTPLLTSSFEDNTTMIEIWSKLGMGGCIMKTIMKEPRLGNKAPRILELHHQKALVNSLGLPGVGITVFAEQLQKNKTLLSDKKPVGLSIGGLDSQEYKDNFSILNTTCSQIIKDSPEKKFFFEFNISCPNIEGKKDVSSQKKLIENILHFARNQTQCVLGVKLSPDDSDSHLKELSQLISGFPKTYINLGNTSYRSCRELGLSDDALFSGGGGLSGAPLYKRTLEMVELISTFKKIPIIATGGIFESSQVKELRDKGALLMGLATSLISDPYQIPLINQYLQNNPLSAPNNIL